MGKEIRQTGTFVAKDKNGADQSLYIFTEFIDASDSDDPYAKIEAKKYLETENGLKVNRLEKGKYQIVASGEILHSDDPNAP